MLIINGVNTSIKKLKIIRLNRIINEDDFNDFLDKWEKKLDLQKNSYALTLKLQ